IQKGDIIVTAMTRPHFLLGIRRSAGIIADLGGNLCHAAIVAREFNIPAVVGTQNATTTLEDGQKIILDGNEGYIYEY
ncbi:MAG: PEP-utilizing enzyme, partial [Candidatus Berkelbacteria bacterium]|nr:PEP-utilizing enzyme [Candidatus Berkelbacteria bacterium]